MDAGWKITMTTQCAYAGKAKHMIFWKLFSSRFMSQVFAICIELNSENVTQFCFPPTTLNAIKFFLLVLLCCFKNFALSDVNIFFYIHACVIFILLLFIRKTCVEDTMPLMVMLSSCMNVFVRVFTYC